MGRIMVYVTVLLLILAIMATGCLGETSVAKATMINKDCMFTYNSELEVQLVPTDKTVANTNYQVDLYEKGKLRSTNGFSMVGLTYKSGVSWNQAEVNVKTEKSVYFPLSSQEGAAYDCGTDLSNIFSVKVHA